MTSPPPNPESNTSAIESAWLEHHQRVLNIGYRMLSSVTDAEDVAQEAFARLAEADIDEIDDILGWLVTVTSRMSIDRLRLHENSRKSYVGPWLPEPVVDGHEDTVGDQITLDDSVRMALLVVLDRLTPAERVAFVLHDVFTLPFAEVGEIVGRSPQACRQLAARARRRIQSDSTAMRPPINRDEHREIVQRFANACSDGDMKALVDVLATDATGDFDSGGMVPNAPLTEVDGGEAIAAQLVTAVSGFGAEFVVLEVNGDPGVLITIGGHVMSAISLGVRDGQIDLVHAIGNPAKLTHLQPAQPT